MVKARSVVGIAGLSYASDPVIQQWSSKLKLSVEKTPKRHKTEMLLVTLSPPTEKA